LKTFQTKTWDATKCNIERRSTAANAFVIFDTFAPRGCIKYLDSQRGRNFSICSRSITEGVRLASTNPDNYSKRSDSVTKALTISLGVWRRWRSKSRIAPLRFL